MTISNKTMTRGSYLSCGCGLLIIILNLVGGAWSVNYLLEFFLDKTIAWGYAFLIGIFSGQFSIPIAVIMYLLEKGGVL
jgi:hypothetical protein